MMQEGCKEIRIVVHSSWEGGPRTFCHSCYVATYQVVMERCCSLTAAVDVRGQGVVHGLGVLRLMLDMLSL